MAETPAEPNSILKTGVVNLHSTRVPDLPQRTSRADMFRREIFIPFGLDNRFPQAVGALNRKATSHRSLINNKTVYMTGKGFSFDESSTFLEDLVRQANGNRESLRAVFRKLFKDFNSGGNAYLVISTDRQRSFISFTHQDWSKGRVHKDRDKIVFHPKWASYRSKKSLAKILPIYPEFEEVDGMLRSVFHYKDYEPEYIDYGLPAWVAAMDAAGIAYKTNKWNLSRLDNSFQTSGVFLVDGKISEGDAEQLEANFKKNFTGEKKQGKMMFIIKQLGGGSTTYTPITSANEGDWIELHSQSDQDLIMAHQWFRALSGLADSTGFDTKRILNEYEIALNTTILDGQQFILDPIKMIIEDEMGVDVSSLEVINRPPVSILGELDFNAMTKINEGRRLAGHEELDESDERGEQFIKPSQVRGTIEFGE